MRIGELARQTGISASRIRFYEERGVRPPAMRRGNGYRDYPPAAAEILRFIVGGQALGFSLGELSTAMSADVGAVPARGEIVAGLQRKHAEIGQHIKAATAKRRQIAALIEELTSCDVPVVDRT